MFHTSKISLRILSRKIREVSPVDISIHREQFRSVAADTKPAEELVPYDPFYRIRLIQNSAFQPLKSVQRKAWIHDMIRSPSAESFVVSPWHNVPMYAGSGPLYHFVCEMPLATTHKVEMSLTEPMNPFLLKLRHGVFGHGAPYINTRMDFSMPFCYGHIAQTFSSKSQELPAPLGSFTGDGRPLDAILLAMTPFPTGSVVPARVLGVYGFHEHGKRELDLKIVMARADEFPSNMQLDNMKDDAPGFFARWFIEADHQIPGRVGRTQLSFDDARGSSLGYGSAELAQDLLASWLPTFQLIQWHHMNWMKLLEGELPSEESEGFWLPSAQ